MYSINYNYNSISNNIQALATILASPIKSNLSGRTLSVFHHHRSERIINIPPYVAYTHPKLELNCCSIVLLNK